jgi:hypothetical protein
MTPDEEAIRGLENKGWYIVTLDDERVTVRVPKGTA